MTMPKRARLRDRVSALLFALAVPAVLAMSMLTKETTADKPDLLKDIQRRRDDLEATVEQLLELASTESRDLTDDESTQFANLRADIEKLDKREADLVEMAEQRRVADQRRARYAAAVEPDVELVHVRREPMTYSRGSRNGYFRDIYLQARNDPDAIARLQRHAKEIHVEAEARVRQGKEEFRDLTTTDTAGGFFVPPLWLIDQYAPLARASRATADLLNSRPLPGGTDSINIPRITTGTATAIQTANNAAVQETDIVDASVAAPVRTIAGQQDVSVQLLEQSPIAFDEVVFSDLIADYNTKLDVQVLAGSGSSGQVTGLTVVSSINAVTYTDATPTVAEIYAKIADAIQQIHTNRFQPPTAIVMHPRRWAWFMAALDTTNRPLVLPNQNSPMNAIGIQANVDSETVVGTIQGLPVITDPSIATNGGGGTNEDYILILRAADSWLFESSIRTRVLPDVGSGTLTTRLQVYGFVALATRYAKSISQITGTGLVAPTF